MKTFKDLEFERHPVLYLQGEQALMEFDNGNAISVVLGSVFYSNGIDTYEAWCRELDNEPRGYLSEKEVTDYMIEAQKSGE